MFEWCSIAVMSTSSPARTFASPQARATRLMLSVAFRVKMISVTDRGVDERAHLLARALVGRGRALAESVCTPRCTFALSCS